MYLKKILFNLKCPRISCPILIIVGLLVHWIQLNYIVFRIWILRHKTHLTYKRMKNNFEFSGYFFFYRFFLHFRWLSIDFVFKFSDLCLFIDIDYKMHFNLNQIYLIAFFPRISSISPFHLIPLLIVQIFTHIKYVIVGYWIKYCLF